MTTVRSRIRHATAIACTTVAAVVAALTLVGFAAPAAGAATSDDVRRITVTGTGEVKGTPDVMELSVGVEARAGSAADALRDANERANKVLAVLRDAGVGDDDLQTTGLTVQPTYGRDGAVTGYEASNRVIARVRDLDRGGAAIDAATNAAGDAIRVDGVRFTIDDDSKLLDAARVKAVKRARVQAEQLAAAAGVKLGMVRTIDEGSVATPSWERAETYSSGSADAAAPIEPGSRTLTVQTTVVFDIE